MTLFLVVLEFSCYQVITVPFNTMIDILTKSDIGYSRQIIVNAPVVTLHTY